MLPLFAIVILCMGSAYAQQDAPAPALIGYVDENRDGINDRFRDADGDGIDDISAKPYPHRFRFVDEDGDGKNDLFIDADGDGVNDLDGRFRDEDADGFTDNVLDFDGDGKNDITGAKYGPRGLGGYRYGRVFEERGHRLKRFRDEDGDGMHDPLKRLHQRLRLHKGRMDFFLDEDGDGIDDARLLRRKSGLRPTMLDQADPKLEKRRLQRLRRYDPEREKRKRGGRN